MKLTKKLEAEIKHLMNDYWDSYFKGDLETWASYLPDNYRNIGTTQEEIWNSKQDIVDYTNRVFDQMVGMAELRNKEIQIIPLAPHFMVHELGNVYIKTEDGWSFYAKLRLSSLLEKTDAGWKILHQHGSYPDSKVEEGETFAFDKISKENLELRDAIKRRTAELEHKNRELEIEASLERVRARTMAMQHSDELIETSELMFEQIKNLDIELWSCGFSLWYDDDTYFMGYNPGPDGKMGEPLKIPLTEDVFFKTIRKAKRRGDKFLVFESEGESLEQTYRYMDTLPVVGETMRGFVEAGYPLPKYQVTHCGFFSNGHLMFITQEYNPEAIDIFKRFTKIFNQTYTRFLDLQKAEAQAREAQIEAALEKVRSRSLAMHKSEELGEVITVVVEKLKELGFSVDDGVALITFTEGTKDIVEWMANPGFASATNFNLPYFDHPVLSNLWEAKEKGEEFLFKRYRADENKSFLDHIFEFSDFKHTPQQVKEYCLAAHTYATSIAFQKNTAIFINDYSGLDLTSHEIDILKRFSKVFEQTYTRFLDLQKAEAQAREAKIETALEKVRSRSLAMHKSDELNEVVKVLFEKMTELEVPSTAVAIQTFSESSKDVHCFVCGDVGTGIVISQYLLPYFDHPILEDFHKAREKELELYVGTYSKKEKDSFYDVVLKLPELKDLPAEVHSMIRESEVYEITMVPAKKSVLAVNDFQGNRLSEGQVNILKRFGKVFDQAYTRFLDLQKAEAQAREAEIELALERVRARTMAMQHSDELQEASFLLDQQVRALGIKTWGCAFNIYGEKESTEWFGNEAGVLPTYTVPRKGIFKEYYQKGKKGETLFIKEFAGDECVAHYEYMSSLPVVGDVLQNLKKTNNGFPTYQIDHVVYFKYGYLLFITREPVPEAHDIFKRFAKVFEQTYTRFLDLQKAEAQARKAQIELSLERIRAQVTAMQESSDLFDIVVSMRTEFLTLGHEADYFWHMRWLPDVYEMSMTSEDGHRLGMVINVPKFVHDEIPGLTEWEKGNDPIYVLALDADEAWDYIENMNEHGHYEQADSNAPTQDDIRHIGGLTFIIARTTHGEIGFSLAGVVPDPPKEALDTLTRFAGVFDLAYKRFEDLKATERQHREAQIELALERVRSRTLAMTNTGELQEIVLTVFSKLQDLGIDTDSVSLNIIDRENKEMDLWTGAPELASSIHVKLVYFDHPILKDYFDAINQGLDFMVMTYPADVKKSYFERLFLTPKLSQTPDARKQLVLQDAPFTLTVSIGTYSSLHLNSYTGKGYTDENHEVLKRFNRVFDQAYTRFLDLKKAEAQARKAQIEAALDRVRAKAMSMQSSDELDEVLSVLCEQFDVLEILPMSTHMTVFDFENNTFTFRETGKFGNRSFGEQTVALDAMENWQETIKQWKADNATAINKLHFPKEQLPEVWKVFHESFASMPEGSRITPDDYPDGIYHTAGKHPFGYIGMNQAHPATTEEEQIVIKFANEFGRAYQRFLDIKKAEAQAREAQIEAALERVRSRTMGMQHSDELQDTALLLFQQVEALSVPLFGCGFNIWNQDQTAATAWMAGKDRLQPPFITSSSEDIFLRIHEASQKGDSLFVEEQAGEKLEAHYKYMASIPVFKEVMEKMALSGQSLPTFQIMHCAYFPQGYLMFITHEPASNAYDIFKRFAKVFEQTYTRFLDLQKAEAQAREAQIEAALERVRSRSMAMHNSNEIGDVALVLFEQLKSLGGELWGTGFGFCQNDSTVDEFWFANEKGVMPHLKIPNTIDPAHKQMYKGWIKNLEFLSIEKGGKELKDHYKYMLTVPDVQPIFKGILDDGIAFPKWQKWHAAYFKYGYMLVITTETYENEVVFKRFAKVFEQAYTRFLDLQKAEAQAREARIEAALEKVRSRTMAMQKGEEVKDVVVLLYKELIALGVTNFATCGYVEINEKTNKQETWVTNPGGDSLGLFYLPLTGDIHFDARYEAWKKQQPVFHQTVAGKERKKHLEYAITTFNSKEAEEMVLNQFPDPTVFYCFNFSHGYLHLVSGSNLKEDEEILLARFTRVFEQTYARFQDLQKAEEQTRTAQINLAVERVRAKALAMHKSEEIIGVVAKLKDEVMGLDIPDVVAATIFLNEGDDKVRMWDLSSLEHEDNYLEVPFDVTFKIKRTDPHLYVKRVWENPKDYFVEIQEEKDFKRLMQWLREQHKNEIADEVEDFLEKIQLKRLYHAAKKLNNGKLVIDILNPPTDEMETILTKMGAAFDLAYKRFEDLQKAEEQARKSQIELSLERIRTQATSMQKSQDLLDIVVTMHAEFTSLGHEAHYFWHMRWLEDTYQKAMTSGDGSRIGNVMELPRGFHQNKAMNEWEQNEEPIGVFTFDADGAIDYVDRMISEGRFDEIDHNSPGPDDIRAIGGLTFVMARTTHGEIGYSLPGIVEQPPEDDLKTLVRFAGVFDLAYKRFEDLQEAEQRAYESKVEASLERVRSMAAAMNHSDDLKQIAEEMFKEMEMLKINPLRYGLAMIDGGKKEAELWASTVNNNLYLEQLGNLSLTWHPMLLQAYNAWDAQYEEFIYVLKGKELSDYYKKIGVINPEIPALETLVDPNNTATQYCCFFPFKSGTLYAFTDGEPDEDGKSILKRFANVFEQAHIRYDDLQIAEKQARLIREERDRLEIALRELRATQDQLIQQEKLASLGQLTAGIAHEIKNPLNFVNNFSELSVELIEETKDELSSISDQLSAEDREKVEEAVEILHDIEMNLRKIHEHGSRADSIVKSMLEHSRGGTGKLEPTDLNALVKEFVNLSFHGMRAGKNPINVDLQFEPDENIGEVPLIAEDFSRVIVNLSNNAFDAMREKANCKDLQGFENLGGLDAYHPKLTIRTHQQNSGISVEIEDNGPGIPEEIKDKIMQPFFTTKKGTEGTGLGLSITNDIIKAHGGDLKVKTKEGNGSVLVISLPNSESRI